MTDTYIVPRNWDRFQHVDATKRGHNPRWIKNYTALLSDDNYLNLTAHQRAVLHGLWLEYARSGCQLLLNTASLSRRLALRVSLRQLEALNHAGFLEFRPDNVLTLSSLEEKREEKKEPRAFDVDATERPSTSTFGDFLKLVPPEPAA